MISLDRDRLIADLIRDEDEVLHAYRDSEGYWTIGVGILIDERRGGGITREESRYLLNNRIAAKIVELDRRIPWWRSLSEVRQRVVLNMAFNLGTNGLLGFRKALAAMERGDYRTAAAEMKDSKWYTQTGDRAKRLVKAMESGKDG